MDDIAYDILSALRLGSVPAVGLAELAVGRQSELAELEQQLEVVAEGKSSIKFISGDFGAGKSFLCALFRERAFLKGFASSAVVISPDVPLSKLDVIVGKTFDGLRLPEKRMACGLADLLEKWLYDLLKRTAALEGLKLNDSKYHSRINALALSKIDEELSSVHGLDSSFVIAVKTYLRARIEHDSRMASDVLGWLKGSGNLTTSRKNQIGLRGEIQAQAALNYIKGLLTIIRGVGLKGLVWILDEVETVQRLPNPRQRDNSYEELRKLIDQIADKAFPGLQLIVTGTPRLFEDPRYGMPSYEALIDRIKTFKFPDGQCSLRQPIMTLPGFDFELLLDVAKKIRAIHGRAFFWQPDNRLLDSHIKRLAELAVSAFEGYIERTPRVFLKEIVHLCDMLYEHPNLSADEYFRDDKTIAERLSPPGSRFAEPK